MKQYQDLENLNQEGFSIHHPSSIQLILFFLGALVLFLVKLPFQKLKAKDQATAAALSALDTSVTKFTRLSKTQTESFLDSTDESVRELGLRHE
jgi:hypothetical protein